THYFAFVRTGTVWRPDLLDWAIHSRYYESARTTHFDNALRSAELGAGVFSGRVVSALTILRSALGLYEIQLTIAPPGGPRTIKLYADYYCRQNPDFAQPGGETLWGTGYNYEDWDLRRGDFPSP